jgi:hypothetical protein
MKTGISILLLLLGFCSLFSSCRRSNDRPDLYANYKYNDDRINGASLAYRMFESKYKNNDVLKIEQDFSYINNMHTDDNALYYGTASNFFMTQREVQDLSAYIKEGNTVFLAAKYFDSTLLDNFLTSAVSVPLSPYQIPYAFSEYKTELVRYGNAQFDTSFSYYYLPFENHFNETNYAHYRVLGLNSKGLPNFLVFFWGKGKLFLHCDPAAVSNHFLRTNENYKYFEKVLSYLPEAPEQVYIDDYYCNRNYKEGEDANSLLAMIYSRPALAWAFSILVAAGLFYLLLQLKRTQRIMPVTKPTVNDSVNFVEAISTLYYNKKDNKNIAEKMVSYFYDDLRSKYFITNTQMSTDLVATLSHKSGMDIEETQKLFYNIRMAQDSDTISDNQLKELNRLIYKFKHIK